MYSDLQKQLLTTDGLIALSGAAFDNFKIRLHYTLEKAIELHTDEPVQAEQTKESYHYTFEHQNCTLICVSDTEVDYFAPFTQTKGQDFPSYIAAPTVKC